MPIVKTDVYDVQVGQPLDLRTVRTDVASRDNIPMAIRYGGLIVYTRTENRHWYWPQGATSNTDWIPFGELSTTDVFYSETAPQANQGADGDIYFYQTPEGVSIYQKRTGDWGLPLGTIATGGGGAGVKSTPNNAVAYGVTTSAWLETNYPNANIGDIVYSETNFVQFTKIDDGKWTVENIEIA